MNGRVTKTDRAALVILVIVLLLMLASMHWVSWRAHNERYNLEQKLEEVIKLQQGKTQEHKSIE